MSLTGALLDSTVVNLLISASKKKKKKKMKWKEHAYFRPRSQAFPHGNFYPSQFLKRCLRNEVSEHRKPSLIVGPN